MPRQAFALLGTAVVLAAASRYTLLVVALISIFYYRLQVSVSPCHPPSPYPPMTDSLHPSLSLTQRFYRSSSRELKRLDSVSRSPIFTHFSDTLDGAATIRAFKAGDRFLRKQLVLIDDNQRVRRTHHLP